ncbi:MAG: hypothetical protein IPM29_20530 [Planctomycetes bacterium]|nr:hypothetical protein [Planctomycetota bacterium]
MHATPLDLVSPQAALAVVVGLSMLAPVAAQADHAEAEKRLVSWEDVMGSGSTFQLYGFVRLDTPWSDSRFNDNQTPGYVQSEDASAPASIGAGENDGAFSIHPHMTRLGLDFESPTIASFGDPSLTGNIEIDFYGQNVDDSDSRSGLRMRKAYLKLDWEHWSLLAGQDWDLISPLYPIVNNDLVMWGAGNTGDRRPQLRLTRKDEVAGGELTAAFALGLAGAVASSNVEGGLRSGENSELPLFCSRIGWRRNTDSGGVFQAGVWGHYSRYEFDPAGGTATRDFEAWSAGLDLQVPIWEDRAWLLGELWIGDDLEDIRGGIFQGVNPTTGRTIGSRGGFAELGCKVSEHVSLHAGYSFDNPVDGDLSTGMRSDNRVLYFAVRHQFHSFRFGLEFLNWTTSYVGYGDGDANRVSGYIAYYF